MTGLDAHPPRQEQARVIEATDSGVYRRLVLAAPASSHARPGQFVAFAIGDRQSSMLLRRAFSVHRADAQAGTVEVIVAGHGAGTRWVCERDVGDVVDVVGPLGTGFDLPESGRLILVGGGYGSAPFAWTAATAATAATAGSGMRVDAIVGAATETRLCDVEGITAAVQVTGGTVHVCTDDGSTGHRGRVTDVLADLLTGSRPEQAVVVAACGPMAMLAAVAATAASATDQGADVTVQVAVEEAMACGIGICMTCVLPVVGDDGSTRMLRACTDGPVLAADRVRWDCVSPDGAAVPADAVGAPAGGAA